MGRNQEEGEKLQQQECLRGRRRRNETLPGNELRREHRLQRRPQQENEELLQQQYPPLPQEHKQRQEKLQQIVLSTGCSINRRHLPGSPRVGNSVQAIRAFLRLSDLTNHLQTILWALLITRDDVII